MDTRGAYQSGDKGTEVLDVDETDENCYGEDPEQRECPAKSAVFSMVYVGCTMNVPHAEFYHPVLDELHDCETTKHA